MKTQLPDSDRELINNLICRWPGQVAIPSKLPFNHGLCDAHFFIKALTCNSAKEAWETCRSIVFLAKMAWSPLTEEPTLEERKTYRLHRAIQFCRAYDNGVDENGAHGHLRILGHFLKINEASDIEEIGVAIKKIEHLIASEDVANLQIASNAAFDYYFFSIKHPNLKSLPSDLSKSHLFAPSRPIGEMDKMADCDLFRVHFKCPF